MIAITLEVKNGHATEVIEKIKGKLSEPFWQMIGVGDNLTVVNDGGKVSLAF